MASLDFRGAAMSHRGMTPLLDFCAHQPVAVPMSSPALVAGARAQLNRGQRSTGRQRRADRRAAAASRDATLAPPAMDRAGRRILYSSASPAELERNGASLLSLDEEPAAAADDSLGRFDESFNDTAIRAEEEAATPGIARDSSGSPEVSAQALSSRMRSAANAAAGKPSRPSRDVFRQSSSSSSTGSSAASSAVSAQDDDFQTRAAAGSNGTAAAASKPAPSNTPPGTPQVPPGSAPVAMSLEELEGQTGVQERRQMQELDPFEEEPEAEDLEAERQRRQQQQDAAAGAAGAEGLPPQQRRGVSPVPLVAGRGGVPAYQRLPINLELELYRAKTLIKAGNFAPAEDLMRKAVKDWPDDGRPYVVLGRLLAKQGRTGAARAVFEQGCQALGGDNAYIWQCWAVLEARLGNTDRARKLFDAATAADERHAAAWHGWAILELRQGNAARARQLLERGAKVCGESAYIYQSLAVLAVQGGRLEDARALFLRSSQLNPRGAAAWLAWALLEAQQGDAPAARVLFEKALEASPKSRYVWQAFGVFEASLGRLGVARKLLTRGVQLHPKDAVMLQSLALLEYNCGFTGAARELLREAGEADPTHQPVWNAWGWMEWKEARPELARKLFQKSIDVNGSSPGAARSYQAWAVLEEREGNTALARSLFRRALQVDPSNEVVWRSWVAMEERLGNAVRADELRSLFQQQRVEVVESGWDLSTVLTPALDTMKALFKRTTGRQQDWEAAPSSTTPPPTTPSTPPFTPSASRSPRAPPALASVAQADGTATATQQTSRASQAAQEPEEQGTLKKEAAMGASLGESEKDFDVDAFLARRLPKTFQKIKAEEEGNKNCVWRRPMSSGEMRKWKEPEED